MTSSDTIIALSDDGAKLLYIATFVVVIAVAVTMTRVAYRRVGPPGAVLIGFGSILVLTQFRQYAPQFMVAVTAAFFGTAMVLSANGGYSFAASLKGFRLIGILCGIAALGFGFLNLSRGGNGFGLLSALGIVGELACGPRSLVRKVSREMPEFGGVARTYAYGSVLVFPLIAPEYLKYQFLLLVATSFLGLLAARPGDLDESCV